MPPVPFATQSYRSASLPVSAQRCVNCYAEAEPQDAKTPVAVLGSPGLLPFAICGSGPVRGINFMNGVAYVVSGQRLFSMTSLGVVTDIGGSIGGSGIISMANNGTQIVIVNGVNGYVWSQASGFQVITSVNFFPANTVTFFDNFFVFDKAGTNNYFISASGDGTSYLGTDFAAAEVQSDFVLSIVNQQETLLIFGGTTIETWYDAGLVNFPFLRTNGATIERGCAALMTPIKEDNSVFFLGNDFVFYRLSGTSLQRVSTHAIEDMFQSFPTVSDAYTFSYTFDGHKLIVLTFPTANVTIKFDISTNLWHERESWDQNNNSYGRWRGNVGIMAFGKVLIGDAFSGQIGFLDQNTFTEYGNTMRSIMTSPTIHDDRKLLGIPVFELDVESGTGTTTGQGSNPQIMLDWSNDGGRTFKPQQQWMTLGALGAYVTRARWLGLGGHRSWVFRAMISDPIKQTVIRAHAEVMKGEA
jgi:hypothetical protein